nr:uncharacterized protein LOC112283181 isoform X1 [Physcomitrium patens]XP_024377365.1 uncharacterized protein LOC112283181 isoform X1 [Physcomitrium patens]XP_024377366.1 uncharacterized protein LOC112283181 isoform X1 [Physcomitrium patens]XP_024377367.1 uncharacterized protein LOC112283181 isoform X1 [Physcomitrium patens]|eukprot:XP_024377364.1 uncharacterized protein LOC112283181 isoform X1 [Physcomitrella patens]
MGCVASKDGVESNCESRLVKTGRRLFMPLQTHGNSDTGYHMVALTSSTYGILKVDGTKNDGNDKNFVNKPDSPHNAYYEKLKNLDVHEDMVAKTWSEFSRNLPKIPPPTKSDISKQMGNTRGTDTSRLTGSTSFRRVSEGKRRLHSQASRNDHETINMWELMDDLAEDGTAKPKEKLMKRTSSFPVVKPFERSVSFITIHTLSELDSDDPTKAISLGLNGNVVSGFNSVDGSGTENVKPVRTALMPASSPVVPERDDVVTKLMPSSIAPLRKATTIINNSLRSRQPMTLKLDENVSVQETSRVITTGLPQPLSPTMRNVAVKGTTASHVVVHPRQPDVAPIMLVSEEHVSAQAQNMPSQLHPSKSPILKPGKTSTSLNTKLGVEVESAIHKEQCSVSSRLVQPKATTSSDPDVESNCASGSVTASLGHEGAVVRPGQFELCGTSNEPTREVPRFASSIHVLSLAASSELQNRKNSISQVLGDGARRSRDGEVSPENKSFGAGATGSSTGAGKSPTGATERGVTTNSGSSLIVDGIEDSEMDSDLLASFEEALEMFSTEKWYKVEDSKSEADFASDVSENNGHSPMSLVKLGDGLFVDKIRHGNVDKGVAVKPDPWAQYARKCPPAGKDRIVLYTTTLRGIRKTFEDCNNARFILESFNVEIDERDVSIHAEFRQELKKLAGKLVSVPQTFIKGRYIGGVDTLIRLHEDGTLASFVDGMPSQKSREECDGCGGIRFVPCSNCSGSTKVVNEANEVVRCSECNENGLIRCPICN